ncbi:MAG: hypothetical protein II985_06465 [Alistipes sp.]|nr:hypothetical protein [Alistipes sp.]
MSRILNHLWVLMATLIVVSGCSTFEGETVPTERPTTIHFTAEIENQLSRAFFDEKDAQSYTAQWSGGEDITVVALDSNRNVVATTTTTMQSNGTFEATFDNLPATTAYLRAYANRDYNLEEQLMSHDGEVAMRLTSDDVAYVAAAAVKMTFTHDVAYGAMTLTLPTGITAKELVNVMLTIDERNYRVRLDPSTMESPRVWFAVEEDNYIESMRVAFTTTTADVYERVISDMQSKNEPLELSKSCIARFKVGSFVKCAAEVQELDSAKIVKDPISTGFSYLTFEDDVLGHISLSIFIAVSDFGDIVDITMGFGPDPNQIYNNSGLDNQNTFWRPVGSTTQYALTDGSVTFKTTTDNKYDITFNNITTSKGNTLLAHYLGVVEGVDLRTFLSWPDNLRTTVDGKQITVEWDPVTNAVGYEIYCSTEGAGVAPQTTTECSATFQMPKYSTTYEFRVKAIADLENTMYKDSGYHAIEATTDIDPFAEYVMTSVEWSGSYFTFTNESGDYLRVYLNASDRPNNNSIMAGRYSYAGSTGVPAKESFGLNRTMFKSEAIGATCYDTSKSFMTVEVVDGEYRIYWELYHSDYNKTYTAGFIGLGNLVLPPAAVPSLTVSSDSLSFEATGGEKEVTITLENSDAAIEVTCDNAHFGYTLNGTTLRISAPENSSTSELTGTVTVIAGSLSHNIALHQAAAESGSGEGGGDTGGGEGGGEGGGSWTSFSAKMTGGSYASITVTLTGDNGDVMVISGLRAGGHSVISSVILNGTETAVSGTAQINDPDLTVTVNLTVTATGVKYTGTSTTAIV